MKRKVKITFTMDIDYPEIEKETKQLSKDFDQWLKDWSTYEDYSPIPVLVKNAVEYSANGTVHVKIERNKEIIANKSFEV